MVEFLQSFGIMLAVALIPLIIYPLTKVGKDFDPISWLYTGRTRLGLGFVLIILLTVLILYVPTAEDVLSLIGFNTGKSVAAVGFSVGCMLVVAIRGNED
jgi:hypothetical protein